MIDFALDKNQWIQRADEVLNDIRPHLAVDGGDVAVVNVTDEGIVQIKWLGNCQHCSMSAMTLRAGIQATLQQKMPEVTGVEVVGA